MRTRTLAANQASFITTCGTPSLAAVRPSVPAPHAASTNQSGIEGPNFSFDCVDFRVILPGKFNMDQGLLLVED